MILAIPFPLLLIEVIGFWFFVTKFGFFDTLIAYFIPSFLGFMVLGFIGRTAQLELLSKVKQGQRPDRAMLHMIAQFIGAIALLPPLISSRIVAVFLLIPGLRHFIVWILSNWILSKFVNRYSRPEDRPIREARVIDIEPIAIDRQTKID